MQNTRAPKPFPQLVVQGQPKSNVKDIAHLALVMFLWALCFPLIVVGLALAPPLTFAALRAFVAGVGLLLPAILLRRAWPRGWRVWLGLLGVGLTTTSMGFGGMFLAGGLVSPGLATVLANVQPLIATVLGFFLLGEWLGPRRRVGLSLGFAGILLVALPGVGVNANSSPMGISYILLGAVGVAVGNVLLKRLAGQVDILMAIGWQFVLGGLPLFRLAWLLETPEQVVWNGTFVAVLLALGLLGTAVAFALWFSLLHRTELNRLNTATFLTPAFALIIGALFFGESFGWVEVGGITLILAGVLWVSRQGNPTFRTRLQKFWKLL
ncbi:Permease of the drug/metabolite transporter (DMT) superfamily [hydrothermal vent metagenome]|uniref:Permease of the drug/metabolite transporter (DMT) superfamily n=1 Tax=hydrothermal vent metagenome TaxID=652676 RepID=A0A3B0VS10_9ZZZZ